MSNRQLKRRLQTWLAHYPTVYSMVSSLVRRYRGQVPQHFETTESYWNARYQSGLDSGDGSYGQLAAYKASFINRLIAAQRIKSVVELGCGDGNQQSLLAVKNYTGIDISHVCIEQCRKKYGDTGRSFLTSAEFEQVKKSTRCEMSLSLDVVYHIIETDLLMSYITDLFSVADRFVVLYSSNENHYDATIPHIRHREIVPMILDQWGADWALVETAENPFQKHREASRYGSFARFYVFQKQTHAPSSGRT